MTSLGLFRGLPQLLDFSGGQLTMRAARQIGQAERTHTEPGQLQYFVADPRQDASDFAIAPFV